MEQEGEPGRVGVEALARRRAEMDASRTGVTVGHPPPSGVLSNGLPAVADRRQQIDLVIAIEVIRNADKLGDRDLCRFAMQMSAIAAGNIPDLGSEDAS